MKDCDSGFRGMGGSAVMDREAPAGGAREGRAQPGGDADRLTFTDADGEGPQGKSRTMSAPYTGPSEHAE